MSKDGQPVEEQVIVPVKDTQRIEELLAQVELLKNSLQGVHTLSISFLPTGNVLAATISGDGSPETLYAAQKALQTVAQSLTGNIMQTLKEPNNM